MPAEGWIIDASVLAAAFFEEAGTAAARRFLTEATDLTAPSLLALEIASIAAKKHWKGLAPPEVCDRAVTEAHRMMALVEPSRDLVVEAYTLARDHRFSVYDANYLALAQARGLVVVTLDEKLVSRAREAGLASLVILLPGFQPGQS